MEPTEAKVSHHLSKSKRASDNITSTDPKPKRRWFSIGPGIVIALAISALVGSHWIKMEMAARQQKSTPPIVERQVISSSYEDKSGPTPDAGFIIDRAGELHLTDAQLTRIEKLRGEWRRFYGPKIAEANHAADKTNKYLADAESRSRTAVVQIQDAAAPVIVLSGEISAARRSYWDQAVRMLVPAQRKALEAERRTAWASRMKRLSIGTGGK
jgi:hypothetical protein